MAFKQMFLASKPDASGEAIKKAFKRAMEGGDGISTEGDFVYFRDPWL
jgi:hypothetical protein